MVLSSLRQGKQGACNPLYEPTVPKPQKSGPRGTRCGGDIKIKIIGVDYQRIKNALI